MLPWGHAAFGYLLYHLYTSRVGTVPVGWAALAAVFGSQLPDLIDKPLAWTFNVLPSGRSLGHSVFAMLLICGLLAVLLDESRRTVLVAFTIGYGSHLVGDGLNALVTGSFAHLGYLFWPFTSAPLADEEMTFIEFFTTLETSAWFFFGIGLTVVALVVWARDGYPGVRDVLLPRLSR